jgi:hypothetical protein
MEPKTFLIWTCTIIFAATGAITLFGLINIIKIEKPYLNKLFTALILEIVAIGVLAFGDSLQNSDNETKAESFNKAWLVNTQIRFFNKDHKLLSASEQVKLVQGININQSNPTIIVEKNVRRIQFWAVGIDKSGRDINLTFSDLSGKYSDFPYNLKRDSVLSIKDGEINLPPIDLYEPDSAYNPSQNNIKSTSNGPKIN